MKNIIVTLSLVTFFFDLVPEASGTAEPLLGLLPMLCPICRPYRKCQRCPCTPRGIYSSSYVQYSGQLPIPNAQVTGQLPRPNAQVTGQLPSATGQLPIPSVQVTGRFPSISVPSYRSIRQITSQQSDTLGKVSTPDGEVHKQVTKATGQINWNNLTVPEIMAQAYKPAGKITAPSGEVEVNPSYLEISFDPSTGQLVFPTSQQSGLRPLMVDPALRDVIYAEMTQFMANQFDDRYKNSEFPRMKQDATYG